MQSQLVRDVPLDNIQDGELIELHVWEVCLVIMVKEITSRIPFRFHGVVDKSIPYDDSPVPIEYREGVEVEGCVDGSILSIIRRT